MQAISEILTGTVQQMKRERTAAGVATVLETVGTTDSMGFRDLRPGEVKVAMNAARELPRDLLDKAEKSGFSSPILERNNNAAASHPPATGRISPPDTRLNGVCPVETKE